MIYMDHSDRQRICDNLDKENDKAMIADMEKLEKFARKVSRICLVDVEIGTHQWRNLGDSPPKYGTGAALCKKLLALIDEAKVLVGKKKPKKE